ncbi:MAG: N-acetylmuramoyl-L-alanine amidase [Alphaproteobacteria bacterium]
MDWRSVMNFFNIKFQLRCWLIGLINVLKKFSSICLAMCLLFLLMVTPIAAQEKSRIINVKTIQIKPSGHGSGVVITFDKSTPYRVFTVANPPRIIIDMVGKVAGSRSSLPTNRWIKKFSLAKPNTGQTRLLFDLKKPLQITKWRHTDRGRNKNFTIALSVAPSRQMIGFKKQSANWQTASKQKIAKKKITTKKKIAKKTTKISANKTSPKPNDEVGALIDKFHAESQTPPIRQQLDDLITSSNTPPPPATKKKDRQIAANNRTQTSLVKTRAKNQKPLIAIDAGHGGVDSGAIGRRGTVEKLINLAVAKHIASVLERTGRYRVFLTRKGDYYIPLRERYRMAEKVKADFFISIHADSFPNPNVLGASIYTLSNVASDKETARLARRENRSDKYASIFEKGLPLDAKMILLGLGKRQKETQSKIFAKLVVRKFPPTVTFLKNRPHRYAAFTVMKSVVMPSVLLEMGFLSSAKQEKQIITPAFRRNLARCMVRAFDQYFYNVRMKRGC